MCICSIGKNENKYIQEFVQYYKNLKIDKIFIYDNNDIKGEYFQDVLHGYNESNYVEIINFRGKVKSQREKHIEIVIKIITIYSKNKSYKFSYKDII